jgi:translation initiation factor IF-3
MIRTPQVRVVGNDGESLGILTVVDAIARAQQANLDLVEVAPSADPPVCRIMDYGKFKYEKSKKTKEAKKKQHIVHLKEIKLHPKTEEHDYNFKVDHARKFLLKGDRVKVTVVFRGREITHIDFGMKVLERVDAALADIAVAEMLYKREGRNLISNYLPDKIKIAKYKRARDLEKKAESAQEIPEIEPEETDEIEEAEDSED